MKAFFFSRVLREKLLLVAFVITGAAIWLSSVGGRAQARWRAIQSTTANLDVQQRWLVQRARIEKDASEAISHLDSSKTFDSVRLQSELNTLAQNAGLTNYEVSDSQDQSTAQFTIHSVQFSANNVDLGSLIGFYVSIGKLAPYIALDRFSLVGNKANPAQLSASWRVISVEIARQQ